MLSKVHRRTSMWVASLEAGAELLEQGGVAVGPCVARAVRHARRERVKEAGGSEAKFGKVLTASGESLDSRWPDQTTTKYFFPTPH
jgi:hypothetical protein